MTLATASRCAVHPARPAVDRCPVCGRPRCGTDAAVFRSRGCPTCVTIVSAVPATMLELIVRAGLASLALALAGGWVATQYVRSHYFSVIAPGIVGIAVAGAAVTALRGDVRARRIALGVAAAAAVLSAALAFRLTLGGQNPLHPAGRVVPPYVAAIVGVAAWPLLFGPPNRRREPQPDATNEL